MEQATSIANRDKFLETIKDSNEEQESMQRKARMASHRILEGKECKWTSLVYYWIIDQIVTFRKTGD